MNEENVSIFRSYLRIMRRCKLSYRFFASESRLTVGLIVRCWIFIDIQPAHDLNPTMFDGLNYQKQRFYLQDAVMSDSTETRVAYRAHSVALDFAIRHICPLGRISQLTPLWLILYAP